VQEPGSCTDCLPRRDSALHDSRSFRNFGTPPALPHRAPARQFATAQGDFATLLARSGRAALGCDRELLQRLAARHQARSACCPIRGRREIGSDRSTSAWGAPSAHINDDGSDIPEAQAPQPDHNVHDGAYYRGGGSAQSDGGGLQGLGVSIVGHLRFGSFGRAGKQHFDSIVLVLGP
jgi:hypothetical protein